MNSDNKSKNILFRTLLVVILAIPVGFIFLWLGMFMTQDIFLFWHEFLELDWRPFSNIQVEIQRWLEFWHNALGIHIIYVMLYSVFMLSKKIKIRYDLLGAAITVFVFSAVVFDMRAPEIPRGMAPVGGDWGYIWSYSFLFAMIMFAIFTLATVLLDKRTKLREWKKILLSFGVSVVAGFFVSWLVWTILFRVFHG